MKNQKNNTPAPQSSEHTAVDVNHNDSTTEMDEKLSNEPSPLPAPPISIFLQTADFLLNVNALAVRRLSVWESYSSTRDGLVLTRPPSSSRN